jgi:hypothetical protein
LFCDGWCGVQLSPLARFASGFSPLWRLWRCLRRIQKCHSSTGSHSFPDRRSHLHFPHITCRSIAVTVFTNLPCETSGATPTTSGRAARETTSSSCLRTERDRPFDGSPMQLRKCHAAPLALSFSAAHLAPAHERFISSPDSDTLDVCMGWYLGECNLLDLQGLT